MVKLWIKYPIIFLCILSLSTCRKYNEGGLLGLTRKHLFGERKDYAEKTWKLKLYEVNGIDSTHLIPDSHKIPDFYEKFITFRLDNKEGYTFTAKTFLFSYLGYVNFSSSKEISFARKETNYTQCKMINNDSICSRNIFTPEEFKSSIWHIEKLTRKEFIITMSLQNTYRIVLVQ